MRINAEKIIVSGDIHGDWAALNSLINSKRPEVILVCGDFGYWGDIFPKTKNWDDVKFRFHGETRIKDSGIGTKVFFAPGNHEQWLMLEKRYGRYGKEPIAVMDNFVVFVTSMSIFDL